MRQLVITLCNSDHCFPRDSPRRSRKFKHQLNPMSLLQVLVCLAVMIGVAYPQDVYDHFFSGPHPGSYPSIPSIPSVINQNNGG